MRVRRQSLAIHRQWHVCDLSASTCAAATLRRPICRARHVRCPNHNATARRYFQQGHIICRRLNMSAPHSHVGCYRQGWKSSHHSVRYHGLGAPQGHRALAPPIRRGMRPPTCAVSDAAPNGRQACPARSIRQDLVSYSHGPGVGRQWRSGRQRRPRLAANCRLRQSWAPYDPPANSSVGHARRRSSWR